MTLALEIVFAAGIAVVALSFAGVATGRLGDRALLWTTVALGSAAAVALVALGIDLTQDFADTEVLLLTTGGLAAAAIAEAGLLALARGLRRLKEVEALTERRGGTSPHSSRRRLVRARSSSSGCWPASVPTPATS